MKYYYNSLNEYPIMFDQFNLISIFIFNKKNKFNCLGFNSKIYIRDYIDEKYNAKYIKSIMGGN